MRRCRATEWAMISIASRRSQRARSQGLLLMPHCLLAANLPATFPRGMPSLPQQFPGVTVVTKANVYFDGKVISHTVLFPDASKKTLGVIYPGSFHFKT